MKGQLFLQVNTVFEMVNHVLTFASMGKPSSNLSVFTQYEIGYS